uniref:Serum amyloid A protein n=1 Tax=Poecilia reticulata TaxID=8081 RepID=A0A3P9QI69_POERE
MKLLLAGIVLISIIGTEKCCSFYASNTKANCINSNKYYHARGNSDAAKRGNGGVWAAETDAQFHQVFAHNFCSYSGGAQWGRRRVWALCEGEAQLETAAPRRSFVEMGSTLSE